MSDNTLNMTLGIMGCDGPGTGGNHCTHGVCLTASTLLNEEGEFDGDVVEPQLARNTEAKAPAARRGDAARLWKDGLTSHLIRPNPFRGDQLIELSLSELTVFELDQPVRLFVIIVNHGSCMCFDDPATTTSEVIVAGLVVYPKNALTIATSERWVSSRSILSPRNAKTAARCSSRILPSFSPVL